MSDETKLYGLAMIIFAMTSYKIFEKFSNNSLKAKELESSNDALRIQKQGIVDALATSNHVRAISDES